MSYRVTVHNRMADIDREQWNSLASSPFTHHAILQLIEAEDNLAALPQYILVHEENTLVATTIAYLQNDAEYYTLEESLYGKQHRILRRILPRLNPCLLSHNPVGSICPCTEIAPSVREREPIYQLIIDTLDRLARQHGIRQYGFLNIPEDNRAMRSVLTKNGFASSFSQYGVAIKLPFQEMDDYLQSLSRKRRQFVKKELRRIDQGLVISRGTHLETGRNSAAELFRENFRKYQGKESKLSDTLLAEITRRTCEAGGQAAVLTGHQGGTIAACSIVLAWKNQLNLFKVGQNDSLPGKEPWFFATAIYEPIKFAMAHGYNHIGLGSGAYQYKLLRGGSLTPLYIHIKHTNPLTNLLLRRLFDLLGKRKYRKHQEQVRQYL